jgi:hypothetical protein
MFTITIIALLIVCAQAATRSMTCGGLVNITAIEIVPTTMVPGEDTTIIMTINNGYKPITDGLFYYHISSDSTHNDPPQVDYLCDIINCPIPFGQSKAYIKMIVPSFSGHAHMRIEAARQPDMAALFCLHIETDSDSFLRSIYRLLGTRVPITSPSNTPSPVFAIA